MLEGKKPTIAFRLLLFAWLLTGMALWILAVTAPADSLVLDESLGINECPGAHPIQGTPLPHWPSSTGGEIRDDSVPRPTVHPSFLAVGDFPAGAVFRLKLVRAHPAVGPPSPFSAA